MNQKKNTDTYRKIGRIVQTFGLDGRLILKYEISSGKALRKLTHWFVELQEGSYIPFFPENSQQIIEEGKLVWQPDEIFSAEAAKTLVGKDVYVETETFKRYFSSGAPLEEDLTGFIIKDETSGHSAKIETIVTMPGQLLAQVDFDMKSILLPLAEDFILGMNLEKKIIEMKLPEGIWDL